MTPPVYARLAALEQRLRDQGGCWPGFDLARAWFIKNAKDLAALLPAVQQLEAWAERSSDRANEEISKREAAQIAYSRMEHRFAIVSAESVDLRATVQRLEQSVEIARFDNRTLLKQIEEFQAQVAALER